jgi:hypothetical protein
MLFRVDDILVRVPFEAVEINGIVFVGHPDVPKHRAAPA